MENLKEFKVEIELLTKMTVEQKNQIKKIAGMCIENQLLLSHLREIYKNRNEVIFLIEQLENYANKMG